MNGLIVENLGTVKDCEQQSAVMSCYYRVHAQLYVDYYEATRFFEIGEDGNIARSSMIVLDALGIQLLLCTRIDGFR